MYTLKIKWFRSEPGKGVVDENTLFIAADEVHVGSEIKKMSELHAWPSGSYLNYSIENNDPTRDNDVIGGTRMIQVIHEGRSSQRSEWYLASCAWLLGPTGKTIENLTV